MERFISFAIDRPVLNHILLLFILIMAVLSYQKIPKEIFPPSQLDKVVITGGYVGASADMLDKMVVRTIEDDLNGISEIERVSTLIKNGSFSLVADIKSGENKELVLGDVKDIISNTKRDLPADMNEPIAKVGEGIIPLALLAIASNEYSTKGLLDIADVLKGKLSQLPALSDITIRGDSDMELVIELDEKKIEAYGLNYAQVSSALGSLSTIFPIGTIKEQGSHIYVSTINGEKEVQDLESIIISVGAQKLFLKDVANVSFDLSDAQQISHFNGQRNISININKSKEGNAIALVREIRQILKAMKEEYPRVDFEIYTDTSIWIKNRLNTVFSNIVFGLFLLFIALFLSVHRGIAIVVALGIPLSFMTALIATEMIGFSLNMLSLLGALIALGMLVDEAIVVAENIYRKLEEGLPRRQAVIEGSAEMFPAVLTATLTTVFAFLPLLILSGEMGIFLRILPVVIAVLLLSSLFEAFYFLPLHANDFMKVHQKALKRHTFWENLYTFYSGLLTKLLRKKWVTLIVMVTLILSATILMVKSSKFQLFPTFDTTQFYVSGKVGINNDLEDTEKIVERIEKVLLERLDKRDVSSVTSVIGLQMNNKNEAQIADYLFHIFIDLHEKKPDNFFDIYINPYLSPEYDGSVLIRERFAHDMAKEVEGWMKPFKAEFNGQGEPIFEELKVIVPKAGVVAHDVELLVTGESTKAIAAVNKLEAKLSAIDGVFNVANDVKEGVKELKLRVNRYGYSLGMTEALITSTLRALYLKAEYSKMFNDDGLIRIVTEGKQRDIVKQLNSALIQVPGTNDQVRLDEVVDFTLQKSFAYMKKENGERIYSLYATGDKTKITSSEIMKILEPTFEEVEATGVNIIIKGEEQQNKQFRQDALSAVIIAVFLIFITLVWMFNSFISSLIVISVIPLSILGAYIGHAIMGLNMSMPGVIGIIGLSGVVVNDALIMLDFVRRAKTIEEVVNKAILRIRPILLTSVTTLLGLSSLIFFASGQSLILQPMAVSLGFGLAWATVLNLIYIPVLYSVVYIRR
jgi:multidrug efflux pump subunit AcrB